MILLRLRSVKIGQQSLASPYKLKKRTLRVIVMGICFQVVAYLVYSLAKQGYLNSGRPSVIYVKPELRDYAFFLFLIQEPVL